MALSGRRKPTAGLRGRSSLAGVRSAAATAARPDEGSIRTSPNITSPFIFYGESAPLLEMGPERWEYSALSTPPFGAFHATITEGG